ncbi:hypothetical protein [Xanthomonas populi]|uniref:hypothetical protein n=1 Tax=Xanthomonas populi TaxID=53414 RepID=UPI000FF8864C|nr:hypothetical protein [Xanthomonas populi]
MTPVATWVGVDVSKARLDVYVFSTDQAMSFANEQDGIAALIQVPQDAAPWLIVLEASGGLERAVVARLLAAAPCAAVGRYGAGAPPCARSCTWRP